MALLAAPFSAARVPDGDPLTTALGACRRHLLHAAVFSAAVNLLNLAPTLFMLQVYDRVVPSRNGATLALLFGVFVLAASTMSLLDFLRSSLLRRASVRLDRLLARPVIARMLAGDGRGAGTGAMRELDALRQTITGNGAIALFDAPWVPLYVGVCFLLHPAIGLLALGGGGALFVVAFASERRTAGLVRRAGGIANRAYASLEHSVAAAPTIRALGMADILADRHLAERGEAAALQLRAGVAAAHYVSAAKTIRLILQSSALALGALLAINEQISLGAIFAASLLLGRALAPIEQVTASWNSLTRARAAWSVLSDLVGRPLDPEPTTRLPEPLGALSVEDLTVVAPGDEERRLLDGISFALEPGEMLAIIGPNGSGKSTLARAIAGAIRPDGGAVRLDGARLEHWPVDQRAGAIGFMPQEPALLPGTVKQNIARFARGPVMEDRVIAAAQASGAHSFILTLPQAYDTEIGPRGVALSLGQAQRLSLTRALCGQPRLLVLDEPNASLDAPGEEALIGAIRAARAAGTTVIVVAHRDRLVAEADRLLVLKEGRVAEFGVRAEMMRRPRRVAPPPPVVAPVAA